MILPLLLLACFSPDAPAPNDEAGAKATDIAVEPEDLPVDRLGDPLPRGAVARLGTRRFAQPSEVWSLATVGDRIASGGVDGLVRLWTADGTIEATLGTEGEAGPVNALDAHGDLLVAAHDDGRIRIWRDETLVTELSGEVVPGGLDIVHDIAWAPSGAWFATAHGGAWRVNGHQKIEATGGCGVCVWKPDGSLVRSIDTGGDWTYSVAAHDDVIASGHESKAVRRWNANSGAEQGKGAHIGRVTAIAALPGGRFTSGDEAGQVLVWDEAGASTPLPAGGEHAITDLAAMPTDNGVRIAWANTNYEHGLIGLDGAPSHTASSADLIRAIAWTDADTAVHGGLNKQLWHFDATALERTGDAFLSPPSAVGFTADGATAIVVAGGEVSRFHTADSTLVSRFALPKNAYSAALSPDGRTLAVPHDYNKVALVDTSDGTVLRVFGGTGERNERVRWSGNGQRIVVSNGSPQADVYDVATGQPVASHTCTDMTRDAALDFYGERITVGCEDGSVTAYAVGGKKVRKRQVGEMPLTVYGLGGLAIGGPDGKAKLWVPVDNWALWQSQSHIEGHLTAMAFRPDGAWLAFGGSDGTVSANRISGGMRTVIGKGHEGPITDVAWSPGGTWLASASQDGTVLLWEPGEAHRALVIGHRGFPAKLPDHTLAGYEAAIRAGAEYLEPDLVSTKDGVLIARHENELSSSTDVAQKFPDRKTTKTIDGEALEGWFSEDFTAAEIGTLTARQPLDFRPKDEDGTHGVPTFEAILALANALQEELDRPVGVYPETKHPAHFKALGLALEPKLLAALDAAGRSGADGKVFIQSFDAESLETLRASTEHPLIQLVGDEPLDSAALNVIAEYADGIGLPKTAIVPRDDQGISQRPRSLVRSAHAAGLVVHVYTFRPEERYLAPIDQGDPARELQRFYALGVDGVFADAPDVAHAARVK